MKKAQSKSRAKKAAEPEPVRADECETEEGLDHDHEHGHDHGDGEFCNHDHGGVEFELAIRAYKPEDYADLKAVWKAGEIVTDETDSAKALKENLEKRKDGFKVFVAEIIELDPKSGKHTDARQIVGGVIVTFDGHRAYVYHFAVHPDFRGVGLGAALLETCEHQAKLWGAKHLRLMSRTDAARDGARKLYEKQGWKPEPGLIQYKKDFGK